MAGAEGMVEVEATKMATTIHHRPIPNRRRIRNKTRAQRLAPHPGGLDCSAAPPQAQLPGTPWGVATTTAGPAQGKPARQTGSGTATAMEQALRARPLGEVEGRRLLHRLAAGRGMNLRALAGVAGGRCGNGMKMEWQIHNIRHIDWTTCKDDMKRETKRNETTAVLLGFQQAQGAFLLIGNAE